MLLICRYDIHYSIWLYDTHNSIYNDNTSTTTTTNNNNHNNQSGALRTRSCLRWPEEQPTVSLLCLLICCVVGFSIHSLCSSVIYMVFPLFVVYMYLFYVVEEHPTVSSHNLQAQSKVRVSIGWHHLSNPASFATCVSSSQGAP